MRNTLFALLSPEPGNALERARGFLPEELGRSCGSGAPSSRSLTFVSFPFAFIFCRREVALAVDSGKNPITNQETTYIFSKLNRRALASKVPVLTHSFCSAPGVALG